METASAFKNFNTEITEVTEEEEKNFSRKVAKNAKKSILLKNSVSSVVEIALAKSVSQCHFACHCEARSSLLAGVEIASATRKCIRSPAMTLIHLIM